MKLLVFVDLHGSLSSFEKLKKKSEAADVLVCAGDISVFEQGLDHLMEMLNNLGKPLLVIPGNHESESVMQNMCNSKENCKYLHKGIFVRENYIFIGYGGGGFSYADKGFEKMTHKIVKAIGEERSRIRTDLGLDAKIVLITHAPPHGTKVDLLYDDHCGNISITKFIKKAKPHLAVCGHFHETAGVTDTLGETFIINPGPEGVLIDL